MDTHSKKRGPIAVGAALVGILGLASLVAPGCEWHVTGDGGDSDSPGVHTREEIDAMYAGSANCSGLGGSCDGEGQLNHCCGEMSCDILDGCCALGGNPCHEASDCCSRSCDAGVCGCSRITDSCVRDEDCCQDQPTVCVGNGANSGAYVGRCVRARGGACTQDLDCVGGACGPGGVCACSEEYHPCANSADCCSGLECQFESFSGGNGTCHAP